MEQAPAREKLRGDISYEIIVKYLQSLKQMLTFAKMGEFLSYGEEREKEYLCEDGRG